MATIQGILADFQARRERADDYYGDKVASLRYNRELSKQAGEFGRHPSATLGPEFELLSAYLADKAREISQAAERRIADLSKEVWEVEATFTDWPELAAELIRADDFHHWSTRTDMPGTICIYRQCYESPTQCIYATGLPDSLEVRRALRDNK